MQVLTDVPSLSVPCSCTSLISALSCYLLLFVLAVQCIHQRKEEQAFACSNFADNRCCPEASPADKTRIQKRVFIYSCMHSIMARHATPNNALASAFVDKCATMGIDAPLAVLEYLRSIPSALIWNQKDNVAEYPPLGTGRRVTGSGLPCMICIHFPRTVFSVNRWGCCPQSRRPFID